MTTAEFDREVEERLVRYAKIDTQSDDASQTAPSSAIQFNLLNLLVDELKEIGAQDVTVSSSEPTFRSAFTVAANEPVSSIPSRWITVNPVSLNVTVYVPGRRSTIWYWPVPSVTTARTFSIRAGLDASTVTPGRTAPDVSLTTPAMEPCALAAAGKSTNPTTIAASFW